MKVGDLVREYVGGPILRIVELLDACRVAICKVVGTGALKRIAVASLIAVGITFSTAHGHPPEDPPNHPVIEKTISSTTVVTSGGTVTPFALNQEGPWVPQVQRISWTPVVFLDDEVLPFPGTAKVSGTDSRIGS